MKRFTFGTPEKFVPSYFCKDFTYTESPVRYSRENFTFGLLSSGCTLEFPIEDDCHIFGFVPQLPPVVLRGEAQY